LTVATLKTSSTSLQRFATTGFGASQADIGFQRRFRVTDKLGLRFRAEFCNIFNHPNFGGPTNSLPSPLFGISTQNAGEQPGVRRANGGFNPLYHRGIPTAAPQAARRKTHQSRPIFESLQQPFSSATYSYHLNVGAQIREASAARLRSTPYLDRGR
jgi:hypothetical protein